MITLDTNLKNKATSQYTNFPFNSFCRFEGRIIAACNDGSSDGLYTLNDSDKDAGEDIDAFIKIGATDIDTDNPKALRFLYFAGETEGSLILELEIDGEPGNRPYEIPAKRNAKGKARVGIGSDERGQYFAFKIKNINGAFFAVDVIKVLPIRKSKGLI